jgi:hypothetical protein
MLAYIFLIFLRSLRNNVRNANCRTFLKLKLNYDRQPQSCWHPSGTRDQFFSLLEISFRQLTSLTRGRVCNLLLLLVLTRQRSPAGLKTIFYCLNSWDPPNLEGQVPVFISPRNRVAQLCPRALCSLSVASYDSQGLRWRYSNPPPHGNFLVTCNVYKAQTRGNLLITDKCLWVPAARWQHHSHRLLRSEIYVTA